MSETKTDAREAKRELGAKIERDLSSALGLNVLVRKSATMDTADNVYFLLEARTQREIVAGRAVLRFFRGEQVRISGMSGVFGVSDVQVVVDEDFRLDGYKVRWIR